MSAFDFVFQFPYIAWPGVTEQQIEHGRINSPDRFTGPQRKHLQKILDEDGDVLLALPQGRDRDREHIDAMEQVFSEQAFSHEFIQVLIGRDRQAHIHESGGILANGSDLARLENSEQFDLHGRRSRFDFIEKEGALVGRPEHALVITKPLR